MPRALLEIKEINKKYAQTPVLHNLSLTVEEGEIFGLLGPNGSGKTTFIKCMLGLLKLSSGSISYGASALTAKIIRDDFGYLPENFSPPQELNAQEFLYSLSVSCALPKERIGILLEELRLEPRKKIGHYSRGMLQRLGLATAFLKDPKIIFLDEPTLGLDPVGQAAILAVLKRLHQQKKTVFFSSHNLFHVEKICTRVAVIQKGVISFVGSTNELMRKFNTRFFEEAFLQEIGEYA